MNSYFAAFVIKSPIKGGGYKEFGYGQIIKESSESPVVVMNKIIGAVSIRYEVEVRQVHITQFNKI